MTDTASGRSAERLRERQDPPIVVEDSIRRLARWMRHSKCTLVYTGAGISTAASIPDYRGPQGVWTLAERGEKPQPCPDMSASTPTTSHMVLKELCKARFVSHVLSQNCDGLHLRSGIPQKLLSEVHGNMYIEVCPNCRPLRQYVRPFDVTSQSQFKRHQTGRKCPRCDGELVDTIVHFGEIGRFRYPLNWAGVKDKLDDATLIICLGTSCAVLKAYKFLWPRPDQKCRLVIVNLQWTPKDKVADLKIHAKCDDVLRRLGELLKLNSSPYCRICDPVLSSADDRPKNALMRSYNECRCKSSQSPKNDESAVENGHPENEHNTAVAAENGTAAEPPPALNPPSQMLINSATPSWWTVNYNLTVRKRPSVDGQNSAAPKKKRKRGRRPRVAENGQESVLPKLTDEETVKHVMDDILNALDPHKRGRKKYPTSMAPSCSAAPPPRRSSRVAANVEKAESVEEKKPEKSLKATKPVQKRNGSTTTMKPKPLAKKTVNAGPSVRIAAAAAANSMPETMETALPYRKPSEFTTFEEYFVYETKRSTDGGGRLRRRGRMSTLNPCQKPSESPATGEPEQGEIELLLAEICDRVAAEEEVVVLSSANN